ncbi:condensation domain-containing protein [Dictyobacter arantiisoli]|uniref:Condensation domain-containing protein n=1 Tax=Dictyobacter arantiisoli TaxID=2014874 RepID=A0A5A5TFG0_9CHLR|nr:condensation domain-containing protein [Dictyobacter arantiisoli]GCF09955.1 hypothetical protein KDI_35190 [Dictyobacter arantiisoli]
MTDIVSLGEPFSSRNTIALTEAQQHRWIESQMGKPTSKTVALELQGPLSIDILHRSLQQVVDRHEALRTTIDRDGTAQHISSALAIDFPLISFSHFTADERDEKIKQWLKDENARPFNLIQGPLFRFSLFRWSEQWHLLVVTVHRIVVDSWSINIFFQDLGALYTDASKGIACKLEQPMQFREFIQLQAQMDQSIEMSRHEQHWLQACTHPLPILELPIDHSRLLIKTYHRAQQSLIITTSLYRKIKHLSRAYNSTLFMTLLTGYAALLHRLSQQDDIFIGFPTSGRSICGSESMIGYCSHLIPCRSQLAEKPTWIDYLKYMKQNLLSAYEHQDYPYARLLNKLNLPYDPARPPLVAVTFDLEVPITTPLMNNLEVKFLQPLILYSGVDIHLNIIEINKSLLATADYNLDLFDSATMQQFLAHYQNILTAMCDAALQR